MGDRMGSSPINRTRKDHICLTGKCGLFRTKCALRHMKLLCSEVSAETDGTLIFAAPKEQLHCAVGITSPGIAKLLLV